MKAKFPIGAILSLLEKENNCVFLESARPNAENYLSYLFLRPKRVISTSKIDEVNRCFNRLDEALKEGFYVAGFLSYEAGEAFEDRLKARRVFDFPLLWFGVYDEPLIYNHRRGGFEGSPQESRALIKKIVSAKSYKQDYSLKNIRANISQNVYVKAIAKIKELIVRGLTYQVNYTFKLKFSFSGSSAALYLDLRDKQSVSYSAYIRTRRYSVLSFSPELFFRKGANKICTRPMKGTAARGRTLEEDLFISKQLKGCPKNKSENLMIVDLLRNDLGRVSTTGSVRVRRLFNVERYKTLFQMTSDIESRLKERYSSFDLFTQIFPSGSVTGAPKIKTMEIIRRLEKEPRNVYTGSIGFFSPQKCGTFNVAIRTLLIDTKKKAAEMGVGSGIVYDSDAAGEYAECRLKADFLVKKPQSFKLIETILWQPDKGFSLLGQHLKRLENSAKYFDFVYKGEDVLAALARLEKRFKQKTHRVRLLLDKEANIRLEASKLERSLPTQPRVYLCAKRTDSRNPFLYHKSTNRKIYDREYKRCRRLGFYDVIFANEKEEITEGAISNIFIRKNGAFYTPPVSCGLLDGVYRRFMFSLHKGGVKEKVLFKKDLLQAEEIYLCNSVRGLVRVHLERKNH